MDIRELIQSEPLTCDTIARIAGHTPATIKRAIHELHLPCAYYLPVYRPDQALLIVRKINESDLERLTAAQSKGPNRAKSQLHNQPGHSVGDAIASGSDSYKASLAQRRDARRGRANRP